jgi:hypothetical protein
VDAQIAGVVLARDAAPQLLTILSILHQHELRIEARLYD